MNDQQKAAIKQLNRAFTRAAKAGLEFVGCDDHLVCIPKGVYEEVMNKSSGPGHWFGMGDVANHDEAVKIDTKGSYRDSGGA